MLGQKEPFCKGLGKKMGNSEQLLRAGRLPSGCRYSSMVLRFATAWFAVASEVQVGKPHERLAQSSIFSYM